MAILKIQISLPSRWWRKSRYSCSIAGNWTDMDDSLRLFCLRQLLQFDTPTAKLNILKKMLNLPKNVFLGLSDEQLTALVMQLDWLSLEGTLVPIVKEFEHNGMVWRLPKSKFEDGAAIEFPMADQFLDMFGQTGAESDLLKLVGSLAAPLQKGQRQVIATREEAEHRADVLRGLPIETQMAILLYFVGQKQYVFKTYHAFLFDEDEDDDAIVRAAIAEFPNFGWWGSYLQIAESGVFGNYEQVLQTNFHRICMYLIEKRKEAKRIKAASPKND